MEFAADELIGMLTGEEMDTVDYYQALGDEDFDFDNWAGGVSITGLFRRTYTSLDGMVQTAELSFTFATSEMTEALQGDGLIYDTDRYIVREVQVQGNGMTKVLLREV